VLTGVSLASCRRGVPKDALAGLPALSILLLDGTSWPQPLTRLPAQTASADAEGAYDGFEGFVGLPATLRMLSVAGTPLRGLALVEGLSNLAVLDATGCRDLEALNDSLFEVGSV
jgi:hypothetical protein